MDFALLPPEINSGRMYAGPGSGSMMTAAVAWDGLAAELRSAATSYSSVILGLTAGWQGPSSAAMAAAAAPYAAWMSSTASQAEQASAQARAAATAYQTAFAAMVPPPVIAANRSQLALLVEGNLLGQNTPAIVATEAQYADMWAQDAAAMYGYADSAALATQLTPFTEPPQTTNPAGAAGQTPAVTHALGTSAGTNTQSGLTQLMSAVPQTLHSAAAPAAAAPPPSSSSSSITTIVGAVEAIGGAIGGPGQASVVVTIISALGAYAQSLGGILDAAGSAGASSPALGALGAGLGSGMPALGSAGFGAAGSAVSAGMGSAGVVGALSVPPSWAAATPMVRLAAAVLQGTNAAAAPAVTVESAGSAFAQLAVASLAGSVLGGTVRPAISPAAIRGGRPTSDKDCQTPDKLKRVLAELSQEPESVQHWHTDKAHLETLLDQLSKKPGIHAVHLSADDKAMVTPTKMFGRAGPL